MRVMVLNALLKTEDQATKLRTALNVIESARANGLSEDGMRRESFEAWSEVGRLLYRKWRRGQRFRAYLVKKLEEAVK